MTDDAARSQGESKSRAKSPIDQWFEVFVYAPLGLALDARRLFPKLVDRGRNQVVLARVIGKYAVEHGSTSASQYIEQSQAQAAAILHALGLLPESRTAADEADLADFEAEDISFSEDDFTDDDLIGNSDLSLVETDVTEVGSPSTTSDRPVPLHHEPPTADRLAIIDYDNLSASQGVPRLGGLASEELEDVRRYEVSNRGRATILNKIAQLKSA